MIGAAKIAFKGGAKRKRKRERGLGDENGDEDEVSCTSMYAVLRIHTSAPYHTHRSSTEYYGVLVILMSTFILSSVLRTEDAVLQSTD